MSIPPTPRWLLPLLACACARAAEPEPHPGVRLVRELPSALETPVPPPARVFLRLDEVPQAAGARRLAIPFHPRAGWPYIVRLQLRRHAGALPLVTVRGLTPAQSASFGDAPRALDKAAPGEEVGGCYVGPETGAWVTCQRFDYLEAGKGGALL